MKYIRTKNNRISYLISEPNEELTEYEIITSKGINTCCREDEVVKIADSIEELCDEFVYNNQLLYPSYLDPKDTELIAFRYRLEDEFKYKNHKEIYGAIWTKKGLIYVAEMKGFLPNGEINWELL